MSTLRVVVDSAGLNTGDEIMNLSQILREKGHQVFSIDPDAKLDDVIRKLVEHNCGSLVISKQGKMVGIITERDILRACSQGDTVLCEKSAGEFMTADPLTGKPTDSISDIMGVMTKRRIRHMPVMDGGKLVGLISIGDVVKAQHAHLTMENHYLKNYIQS